MAVQVSRAPAWSQFIAWALCGASAALVLLAAFTFGLVAIVPAAAFGGLALLLGGANVSAVGAVAGVGAWGFVLGWLNRNGPGDVCTNSGTEQTCSQEWSPWPFWLVGTLLVITAWVLFVCLRRRARGHRRYG